MQGNMAFITSLSQFITSGISYTKDPNASPYILSSSPPDNTMELYVLEHKLHVLSIPKDEIKHFCHACIRVALLPESRPNFFSFTETKGDYTLIVTDDDFQGFPSHPNLQQSGYLWRVLTVSVGAMGACSELVGVSKIAKSVIGPLADNNISVMCLSTYQSDFILVKECDLNATIKCLGCYFKIFNEDHKRVNDTKVYSSSPVLDTEKIRPIVHPFECATSQFQITGLDSSKLTGVVQILLELMFFQGSHMQDEYEETFFHFSIVHGDISLVLNTDAMNKFPNNVLQTCKNDGLSWRMVSLGEQLGFEECGIVAQVVEPIALESISTYYLSTFHYGHCMVLETDIEKVAEILNKQKLENRRKSRTNSVLENRVENKSPGFEQSCQEADALSIVDGGTFFTKSEKIELNALLIPTKQADTSEDHIQYLVSPDSDCESPLHIITPLEHGQSLKQALSKLESLERGISLESPLQHTVGLE